MGPRGSIGAIVLLCLASTIAVEPLRPAHSRRRLLAELDLKALHNAFTKYFKDTDAVPFQGLSHLKQSHGDPRWRGPYLAHSQGQESWRSPYLCFVSPGADRTVVILLKSLGSDARVGGDGAAADIEVTQAYRLK